MSEQIDRLSDIAAPNEPATYAVIADRIAENMAVAALRVGDAAQDLVGLMNTLVTAGKELESAISIQRELGAASLKAVAQAREAADTAAAAAIDAHEAKSAANVLLDRMEGEYGTVSDLVGNLQERIAALSILGAPLPSRNGHSEAEAKNEEPESETADTTTEATDSAESGGMESEETPSAEAEAEVEPGPTQTPTTSRSSA